MELLRRFWLALLILSKYKNGYLFFLDKLGFIKSPHITYLTWSGLKYKTRRGTTDFAILNETVVFREYLRHGFDHLSKADTVVDFGAQAGDFSVYLAHTFGCEVYSYEPEPDNFALLNENVRINSLGSLVHPIQAAIANSNDSMKLRLSGWQNKGVHSFHYVEGGDFVEVPGIDVLELKDRYDKVDLLKIDIEGGEHEIISERNAAFFTKVKRIVMEYHCQPHVTNSKGLDHLKEVLKQLGFSIVAVHGDAEIGVMHAEK